MALFRVANNRAQFDAAGLEQSDKYASGICFTQSGNARVTTAAPTHYNQGIPMSQDGQVAIVDATAGLPSGTVYNNGLPMSGDKLCVSKNATAVVDNGLPFDSAGALAADVNFDLNFVGATSLNSSITFTRASSATYFNSAGVLTTAANNVPRLDYNPATLAPRGLLIEEQRTNSIRNNTMQGAVAGTPGTLPTNWSTYASSGSGVTRSIVGTGIENGINYVDVRFAGTPSASAVWSVLFEGGAAIAALTGQTWTLSTWASVVGGSTTNVTSPVLFIDENTAAGAYVTGGASAAGATSTFTRYTFTRTLSGGATVGAVTGGYRFSVTAGAAIDITLRIGLPQLEQGAFATSVIPTTTAAATRSADVASVNTLSPWFNAAEGTLFLEWSCPSAVSFTGNREAANLSDNTYNNIVSLGHTAGGNVLGQLYTAGVANIYEATAPNLTVNKAGVAYITNSKVYVANGTVKQSNTSAGVPTLTQLGIGNPSNNGALKLCGWVRRVSYYPSRLSNAQLQALTA